jgi:hypothetical protein
VILKEPLLDCQQVIESLVQSEVGQVIGAQFVSQEGGELFILLEKAIFPIGAKDMMTVFDLLDDGAELTAPSFSQTHTEDLADLVGGQPPQSQLTGAFEYLGDGKVAPKDEVSAVLDLSDGVEARPIHFLAFAFGELRSHNQRPVLQTFADDVGVEPVGGGLPLGDAIDGEEGIVVFTKADLFSLQLLLDEVMPIEIVGGLKGEEGGHTHRHGPQHFVTDVEIGVGKAAFLWGQDAIVGVLGGKLG